MATQERQNPPPTFSKFSELPVELGCQIIRHVLIQHTITISFAVHPAYVITKNLDDLLGTSKFFHAETNRVLDLENPNHEFEALHVFDYNYLPPREQAGLHFFPSLTTLELDVSQPTKPQLIKGYFELLSIPLVHSVRKLRLRLSESDYHDLQTVGGWDEFEDLIDYVVSVEQVWITGVRFRDWKTEDEEDFGEREGVWKVWKTQVRRYASKENEEVVVHLLGVVDRKGDKIPRGW